MLVVGLRHYMEEGAGLYGVLAGEEVVNKAVDVVTAGGGKEAEMAEVDAQHGDVAAADEVDGAEEGAVATHGKQEVEVAVGDGVGDFLGFDSVAMEDVD